MVINHNISGFNTVRQMNINERSFDRTIEKLSSGLRINRAADDASGMAVSEKMEAQVRGLKRATMNAQDDISFIQTAEGYVRNILSALQRLRQLSVQAANSIYTKEDRVQIDVEVSSLIEEIERISESAHFNTVNMLNGQFSSEKSDAVENKDLWFHIGPNMDERIQVHIKKMDAATLGLKDPNSSEDNLTLGTSELANKAIGKLDISIGTVTEQLASLGAYQNRLEMAVEGLMIHNENTQASQSRIKDANMAEETVKFFKDKILIESSTAMLAKVNVKTQGVLRLLS